jgi:two-component system, chemotaxis family, sensor kinase CheA
MSDKDHEILARAVAREGMRAPHEAERDRSEFLARLSHEFRTPLTAVIGFARVLESNRAGNQRPEDLQLLRRVRAGGEELLRLVENVLDHSAMELGTVTPKKRATDVRAAISQVAEHYRSRAAAKGLRLLVLLPDFALSVHLDREHLERALGHLLDNAVKFTASGVIKVKLATDMASGRPSRVTVSDTGGGIPAEALDRIFEAFEQVDGSARRKHGGAGLGLRLASQLCTSMGCGLTAKSEVGRGSAFTITLPNA